MLKPLLELQNENKVVLNSIEHESFQKKVVYVNTARNYAHKCKFLMSEFQWHVTPTFLNFGNFGCHFIT